MALLMVILLAGTVNTIGNSNLKENIYVSLIK